MKFACNVKYFAKIVFDFGPFLNILLKSTFKILKREILDFENRTYFKRFHLLSAEYVRLNSKIGGRDFFYIAVYDLSAHNINIGNVTFFTIPSYNYAV